MKTKMQLERLRLVNSQPEKQPQKKNAPRTGKVSAKTERSGSMELDIRGCTCDDGVYQMDAFLDRAVLSHVSTVTIIHGKGTGLLRKAVHQRLKQLKYVKSFRLGVFGEGEDGVTIHKYTYCIKKEEFFMTETEKMLAGKIYDASDSYLADRRIVAHRLSKQYNDTFEDEAEKRTAILKELIPNLGEDTYLQGPIQFDYGLYTTFGTRCYANFNFVVLDTCPITIGNNVFFGPNCTLATPLHPYLPEERNLREKEDGTLYTLEYGAPIHIGDDCWLAANVTVCGGVTIGAGCIIGAGSVVTRDIPAGSLAAGNPCRVIRPITEQDSIYLKKQLF